MARVSIYVPDDLKVRMDSAGEAINWSEVARPAFEAALSSRPADQVTPFHEEVYGFPVVNFPYNGNPASYLPFKNGLVQVDGRWFKVMDLLSYVVELKRREEDDLPERQRSKAP